MFDPIVRRAETTAADELKSRGMLPRGSALLTSSGNLAADGINAIAHAATGAMSPPVPPPSLYEPTLQSVSASIANCFDLVLSNTALQRMAVPFIGGAIFLQRMHATPEELVATIVDTCIAASSPDDFVLVTFSRGAGDTAAHDLFAAHLTRHHPSADVSEVLKNGDLTSFALHRCDVIMNAANMEVRFGGGLSHAIANATGRADEIDAEAAAAIATGWS